MNQKPGSKLNSKTCAIIRDYVTNKHLDSVSSDINRNRRAKTCSKYLYRTLKIKEFIHVCLDGKFKDINEQGSKIISELMSAMKKYTIRIKTMVDVYDSKECHTRKINPEPKVDLTKQIEHIYREYLMEVMIRYEVERLKRFNCSDEDIERILTDEDKTKYGRIAKKIRYRVRSVFKEYYGAEDNEKPFDRLRDDTRKLMRNLAVKYQADRADSKQNNNQDQDHENR